MDSSVTIRRCFDYSVILHLMDNEKLKADTREDGVGSTVPNIIDEYWMTFYCEGDLVGAFRCEIKGAVTLQIHAYILPDKRKYSKDCGEVFLAWITESLPHVQKLYSKVPGLYKNVMRYLHSFGFKHEGELTDSFMKNGDLYSLHYYGLSIRRSDTCQNL